MVQFGPLNFCVISKNYFGQFVWIEWNKSHFTVAFHFMKHRLKTYLNVQKTWNVIANKENKMSSSRFLIHRGYSDNGREQ